MLEKVESQLNGTIASLPSDPIVVMNRFVRLIIVQSQYAIRQSTQTICERRVIAIDRETTQYNSLVRTPLTFRPS